MKLQLWEKLDRAMAEAELARHCPAPMDAEAKKEIRSRVDRVLRIRQNWVPQANMHTYRVKKCRDFSVETVRFESFPGIWGDASLFLPRDMSKPVPVIHFLHGHSMDVGRFYSPYMQMGRLLAEHGVAFFIPDQFGAGAREAQGHRGQYDVFSCGTTVCGMMILEAMSLFRLLRRDPRFDASRAGFMGHSGGGQNSTFLCPELFEEAALAVPSGFACSFAFNGAKERRLCACDLFPGIVHEFETWHALACMNHRKLLVASGYEDPMIARDTVVRMGHRIAACDPDHNCETYLWEGNHSWGKPENYCYIADFILRAFNLPETGCVLLPPPVFPRDLDPDRMPFPANCRTMTDVAEELTGIKRKPAQNIMDVFPKPAFLTDAEFAELSPDEQEFFIQVASFL